MSPSFSIMIMIGILSSFIWLLVLLTAHNISFSAFSLGGTARHSRSPVHGPIIARMMADYTSSPLTGPTTPIHSDVGNLTRTNESANHNNNNNSNKEVLQVLHRTSPRSTPQLQVPSRLSDAISKVELQRTVRQAASYAQFRALILGNETAILDSHPAAAPVATADTTGHRVAFPQASVLTNDNIQIGAIIASVMLFALFSIAVRPDMWLVASILGGFYGNTIATSSFEAVVVVDRLSANQTINTYPTYYYYRNILTSNSFTRLVLNLGKILAQAFLNIHDLVQGLWFMYRTGQLSYEYYKVYGEMDRKYKVQEKLDAFNARFIEGKKRFDQWERENEIARKLLAGLRTVWLVQEQSYKTEKVRMVGRNMRGRSSKTNLRTLDYFQNSLLYCKRVIHALWTASFFGGSSFAELNALIEETRKNLSTWNLEKVAQRIGSSLAALILVNLIGAMFAVAPFLLGFLAIVAGSLWPTWARDLVHQVRKRLLYDGDNDDASMNQSYKKNKNVDLSFALFPEKKQSTLKESIDLDDFHYYLRPNGEKQWYRVGKSFFSKIEKPIKDKVNISDTFSNWFRVS